jgi:hypothetical protein
MKSYWPLAFGEYRSKAVAPGHEHLPMAKGQEPTAILPLKE